ncbi:L-threonylcarbamoyladenylate synthase [Nematocida sp. LUAm2]|nr:L-threonylcarbamoyladenylate synthase [Nematocida sp. LUAm2]
MHTTEIVQIDGKEERIQRVVEKLQEEPVAFPTETVYGLGALVWREDLIKRVFEIKNRPNDNPLIVHVSSMQMLKRCINGEIPEIYKKLMDLYWPGPLTLLFKKSERIPESVTGKSDYVAIRIPKHKETLCLIDRLDTPIVGPSANKSTRPSPTTAEHVLEDLNGSISTIVDGGPCEKGVESTVINAMVSPPLFLRPGVVTYEELREIIPDLSFVSAESENHCKSCPGMRYKHYSPTAPVMMAVESVEQQIRKISEKIENGRVGTVNEKKKRIGLLLSEKYLSCINTEGCVVYSLGNTTNEMSQRLFDGLRYLDRYSDVIYTLSIEESQEGRAFMDRLGRASSETF